METKDLIATVGIAVTFLVSAANLAYSLWSNKRTFFVNTVTTSRLKWIDSLRDKVSEFIAVTTRLVYSTDETDLGALLLQRDTLLHQVVLHLNPNDTVDNRIKMLVGRIGELTDHGSASEELLKELVQLRDATATYLKKEWDRVKAESRGGPS